MRQQGISLIELIVTLAVAAVICAWQLPNLRGWWERLHQRETTAQILHALQYARQEAVFRNEAVFVCPGDQPNRCHRHWLANINILHHLENGQSQTLRFLPLSRHTKVAFQGFSDKSGITFFPDGTTDNNGTFTIVNQENAVLQQIILSKSGRARLSSGD